jgi:hypothetical protein
MIPTGDYTIIPIMESQSGNASPSSIPKTREKIDIAITYSGNQTGLSVPYALVTKYCPNKAATPNTNKYSHCIPAGRCRSIIKRSSAGIPTI